MKLLTPQTIWGAFVPKLKPDRFGIVTNDVIDDLKHLMPKEPESECSVKHDPRGTVVADIEQ